MLTVIMLSVVHADYVIFGIVRLSVIMLNVFYVECHIFACYAEHIHAQCRYGYSLPEDFTTCN